MPVDGTLNNPTDIDRNWSAEFALPFSALAEYSDTPSPPSAGDTWRVNFSRIRWKHRIADGAYERAPNTAENNWVWSPQGKINMHLPQHWGYVIFVGHVSRHGQPN